MKRKFALGMILLTGGIFLSSQAFAQGSPVIVDTGSVITPNFFVAILAGVLMALGFQMVLTNLSVAGGISAIGNIRNKFNKSKKDTHHDDRDIKHDQVKESRGDKKQKKDSMPVGVMIFSGAGAWALLTGIIALFFASFFAVKLSLIDHNGVGVALGLTIWAVFSFVMVYLESKGIANLINGIFSTAIGTVKAALSGVGAVVSGTGSIFKRSPEAKIERVASHTVDKIGKTLNASVGNLDLGNKLDEYFKIIAPKPIDLHQIKDELAQLLSEIRIVQRNGNLPGERELILSIASQDPRFSKEDVSTMDKILDIGKSTLKVAGAIAGSSGIAAAVNTYFKKGKNINIPEVKHEVEDYVMKQNLVDVDPEIVRAELDEIFDNESLEKIKAHQIDKEYVAAIVADLKGVSRESALKAADSVEEALNNILRESSIMEIASSKVGDVKDDILHNIEDKVRSFLNKINRPELDYDLLKSEFEFIMEHPDQTGEVLKRKLKQFDRNTLMGILSSKTNFSQNDINKISMKFDEAKANVMNRLSNTEGEVRSRLDEAKDYALIQAENTRKTTAAASWWLFATLVLTGIASALGGMAAL